MTSRSDQLTFDFSPSSRQRLVDLLAWRCDDLFRILWLQQETL